MAAQSCSRTVSLLWRKLHISCLYIHRISQMSKKNRATYIFSLPDDDDEYHSVRVIETQMRTEGGLHGIVPKSEGVLDVAKAKWEQLSSWAPVDSTEYALDPPDGNLFMDTALGDVLVGQKGETLLTSTDGGNKKKKKPRSKLSVRDNPRAFTNDKVTYCVPF